MTTPSPKLTVALSPDELAAFFPGKLGDDLHALAGADGWFDPTKTDEPWSTYLARRRPTVLVSHWLTPPLPDDASDYLRYVAHVTGTVRSLLPRSFLERGIRVTNWGNRAAEGVAENTLMLTLAALRETQHWGRELHERAGWRDDFGDGQTLFDRRVALHGFGRIARAFVALLKPFRVTVCAYSAGVPADFMREHGVEPIDSLEALFSSGADILAELEALTPQTAGSVRESHLLSLRPGAAFVNSGRGAVVDEAALGRLAAAGRLRVALDVFAVEPLPPDSPLRGPRNVTLMPHMGGPTPDRFPACGRAVLDNLRRWQNGEPLNDELTLTGYDLST